MLLNKYNKFTYKLGDNFPVRTNLPFFEYFFSFCCYTSQRRCILPLTTYNNRPRYTQT